MIKMYCRHFHDSNGKLCNECLELTDFANERIDKCVFHGYKPVCSECEIHCYRKDMREKIRTVMRFAGPRMIYKHPILGICHLVNKRKYKYIDPKQYRIQKTSK